MDRSIAILIPVYNGLAYLKRSLPQIQVQINRIKDWNIKIVVIDDGSTDGTSGWLKKNYPEIKVLTGTGSLWWSGGMNMGVRYVLSSEDFNYILLWNHDQVCQDTYFEILVNKISEFETDTMIASKIFFLHEPDVIFNMGAFFDPKTGKRTLNGYKKTDSSNFANPVKVDWTGGMGTLIPVGVFQKIGLFDEVGFAQYYGDADFFLRAKKEGYKLMVLPDLKIWNDKQSSGLEHNANLKMFFRSLVSIKSNHNIIVEYRFLRKHCTSLLFHFYFFANIIIYFASFIKTWLKKSFKKHENI